MLNNSYYYNGNLKKIVAVFGTIFNDISIAKKVNGKMTGIQRVPIAYGPKQKFLARLSSMQNEEYGDVAIKLPRMSFEITSIVYDSASKLNKLNSKLYAVEGDSDRKNRIYQATPYKVSIQLSILAHHQDDALQVFEQIVPYFTPDYTVAVKDLEGPGSITDVPILLTSTNIQDDYEGDFGNSRRTIIYTLDFDIKFKFMGIQSGPAKIIKVVDVDLYDRPITPESLILDGIDHIRVELGDPVNDTPEDYTVITTYGFDEPAISSTIEGLQWTITSTSQSNITISPQGGTIDVTSNTTVSSPNEIIFSAIYFNDPNDPFTGARGQNGERYLLHNWSSNPVFGQQTNGYGSTESGSYIKVYYDNTLVLDSSDGVDVLKQSHTRVVPLGQTVTLTYKIQQNGDGYLNAPMTIVYD